MKFLFNYKIIVRHVFWLPVMFQILFDHLIRYIPCTPGAIANRPKVATPIALLQLWKLFLKPSRTPSLHPFNKSTYRLGWWIFNMDMHMVLAYHSFQYFNILRLTNLTHQVPTSLLDISFKNRISILRNPNYMHSQPCNRMALSPKCLTHLANLQKTTLKSCTKVHSFN